MGDISQPRSCSWKTRYQRRELAIRNAETLRVSQFDFRIWAYKCRFCEGWHVGHAPRERGEYVPVECDMEVTAG